MNIQSLSCIASNIIPSNGSLFCFGRPVFLIFGGNGWIGTKVCAFLRENNIRYHIARCRAEDKLGVYREFDDHPGITNVMSFIGRTHGTYEGEKITTIDYLEKPGKLKENLNDNLFSPLTLAFICKEKGVHFTYLGTGCIFEYDNAHPFGQEINGFTEDSKPNFFGSSYSIVKGYTDQLMYFFGDTALNVRIRMPITDEVNERNFITKITSYKKVCSIPNSMTVLNELIPIMVDMAIAWKTGTVNLTNPGLISHNEILKMYKDIVDPNFEWENFTIQEQNEILLSKRSNNYLDTTALENMYPKVKSIHESVKDVMYLMKENIRHNNLPYIIR
jgi:3,5-epimerase/4-reductase